MVGGRHEGGPKNRRGEAFASPRLSSLFLCLFEISQVRRWLILAGRHQHAVRAEEIIVAAENDLGVVLTTIVLGPIGVRVWVANVSFIYRPRPCQGMVDYGDFIVK